MTEAIASVQMNKRREKEAQELCSLIEDVGAMDVTK